MAESINRDEIIQEITKKDEQLTRDLILRGSNNLTAFEYTQRSNEIDEDWIKISDGNIYTNIEELAGACRVALRDCLYKGRRQMESVIEGDIKNMSEHEAEHQTKSEKWGVTLRFLLVVSKNSINIPAIIDTPTVWSLDQHEAYIADVANITNPSEADTAYFRIKTELQGLL
ncbi:hypothetical protein HN924_02145 [Candidatus Woesearchaeota archaeon]|jgi:hypothetical protein|nr:hypothetical protein [Candidatus Woesearchaeota archaeon]MBT7062745.1 hypothetical protein [Candidatus Woesearchaeota archaeon]MBT7402679.1 hypothetical protein [Candidatus Woesearchaeota archaeon]